MKNYSLSNEYVKAMMFQQTKEIAASTDKDCSVKAHLFGNQIIVEATNVGTDTITINTPFDFTVQDIAVTVMTASVAGKTVTLKNGSSAISDVLDIATKDTIVKASSIYRNYASFDEDDNDLKLVFATTGDVDVYVVINIAPQPELTN